VEPDCRETLGKIPPGFSSAYPEVGRAKIMKKYIVIVISLFGILLMPHLSKAAIIWDYRSAGTSSIISGASTTNSNAFILLGTPTSSYTSRTLYITYAMASDIGAGDQCNAANPPSGYVVNFSSGPTALNITANDAVDIAPNIYLPDYVSGGVSVVSSSFTDTLTPGTYYFLQIFNGISVHPSFESCVGAGTSGTFTPATGGNGGVYSGTGYVCVADDPVSCNVPPGGSSGTVSFIYPTSTTPSNNFTNFGILASNLSTSTDSFSVSVNYGIVGTNNQTTIYNYNCLLGGQCGISGIVGTVGDLLENGILLPVQPIPGNLRLTTATTTLYYANATLTDLSASNYGVVATTSISFTVINPNNQSSTKLDDVITLAGSGSSTVGLVAGTVTVVNPQADQTPCNPPSNISDIGGGITYAGCYLAQLLFTPTANVQQYMASSTSQFEQAPPFSQVFMTYNELTNAISSTPASQDLNYSLTLGDGTYVNATYTVPFLTSTTMATAITPSGKTVMYNLEDAMFDLLTLGVMFYVPLRWWQKKTSYHSKT
jgi:hypothetical protein